MSISVLQMALNREENEEASLPLEGNIVLQISFRICKMKLKKKVARFFFEEFSFCKDYMCGLRNTHMCMVLFLLFVG